MQNNYLQFELENKGVTFHRFVHQDSRAYRELAPKSRPQNANQVS